MPAIAHSTQKLRDMIESEKLIKRAQDSVLKKDEPELTNAEVGVIKLLLNKTLPDLKGIEVQGQLQGDITHNLVQVEFIGSNQDTDS